MAHFGKVYQLIAVDIMSCFCGKRQVSTNASIAFLKTKTSSSFPQLWCEKVATSKLEVAKFVNFNQLSLDHPSCSDMNFPKIFSQF